MYGFGFRVYFRVFRPYDAIIVGLLALERKVLGCLGFGN